MRQNNSKFKIINSKLKDYDGSLYLELINSKALFILNFEF